MRVRALLVNGEPEPVNPTLAAGDQTLQVAA
jgi:hypothetical protein